MKSVLKFFGLTVGGLILAFLVAMAVLFFVSLGLIKLGEITEVEKPADAIFVPGARIGGRALNMRLDMAYKLYDKGFAPVIIVTGGQGLDEPTTEAEFMAEYLIKLGVPEDVILLEAESVSTEENFAFSKVMMDENGIGDIIIVSNDYHCYRCGKIAENHGIPYQIQPVQKPKGIFLKGPFRETLAVMWGFFTNEFN
ncbi:MAG: YdcF family protein [Eubacteriales bacterium]